MAATIKIKNSSTTGAVPTSGDLVQGELAVNVTDTGLYTENASGTVVKLNAPSIDDKNTGATKHLTISTGGNLGLGVTPSAWATLKPLEIAGLGNSISGYPSDAGIYVTSNAYYGTSGWRYGYTGKLATRYSGEAGVHSWSTAGTGTAGNLITFTQVMTLDASGNLGIGATSISASLQIQKAVPSFWMAETTSGTLQRVECSVSSVGVFNQNLNWNAGSASRAFTWSQGGTENMRIDSSGNLLVGLTASAGLGAKFQAKATSTGTALETFDSAGNQLCAFRDNGFAYIPPAYNKTTASAANMFVGASGDLYRSTSALKYKQDIRDVEDFDISLLRPVRYKSKCENDDQTKDHLGLIADEAAEAGFEELVTRGASGEVEGFQYERLTVILLKKLQVLEAEVDALKGTK